MTATYTFDVFASLDGYGSYRAPGDWGGYWGKQGPELIAAREQQYGGPGRLVLGATTFRDFVSMLAGEERPEVRDSWVGRMRSQPTTVFSATLGNDELDWPDVTVSAGDAREEVARLKEQSDVPLRSHGSLSLNWALMAAGLVDELQVTIFPVVTGSTGERPVLGGAADFDLDLVDSRVFDGRTLQLTYRPTPRHW